MYHSGLDLHCAFSFTGPFYSLNLYLFQQGRAVTAVLSCFAMWLWVFDRGSEFYVHTNAINPIFLQWHLKNSVCSCVGMRTTRKNHYLANNIWDPILFPCSYMFLWHSTGVLQPSMTPVTKYKWLVFIWMQNTFVLLPHWGNDWLSRTSLRSGIWCLDSYPSTMYSVECDIMSITSPNCLSWLLPKELR